MFVSSTLAKSQSTSQNKEEKENSSHARSVTETALKLLNEGKSDQAQKKKKTKHKLKHIKKEKAASTISESKESLASETQSKAAEVVENGVLSTQSAEEKKNPSLSNSNSISEANLHKQIEQQEDKEVLEQIKMMQGNYWLPRFRPCDYFLETLLECLDEIGKHPLISKLEFRLTFSGASHRALAATHLKHRASEAAMELKGELIILFHLIDRDNPNRYLAQIYAQFFKIFQPRWSSFYQLLEDQEKCSSKVPAMKRMLLYVELLDKILRSPHLFFKKFTEIPLEEDFIQIGFHKIFTDSYFKQHARFIEHSDIIFEKVQTDIQGIEKLLTNLNGLTPELERDRKKIIASFNSHRFLDAIKKLFKGYSNDFNATIFHEFKKQLLLLAKKNPTSLSQAIEGIRNLGQKHNLKASLTARMQSLESLEAVINFDVAYDVVKFIKQLAGSSKISEKNQITVEKLFEILKRPYSLFYSYNILIIPLINKLNYFCQIYNYSFSLVDSFTQACIDFDKTLQSQFPGISCKYLRRIDLFGLYLVNLIRDMHQLEKRSSQPNFSQLRQVERDLFDLFYCLSLAFGVFEESDMDDENFAKSHHLVVRQVSSLAEKVSEIAKEFPEKMTEEESILKEKTHTFYQKITLVGYLLNYQLAGFSFLYQPLQQRTKLNKEDAVLLNQWMFLWKQNLLNFNLSEAETFVRPIFAFPKEEGAEGFGSEIEQSLYPLFKNFCEEAKAARVALLEFDLELDQADNIEKVTQKLEWVEHFHYRFETIFDASKMNQLCLGLVLLNQCKKVYTTADDISKLERQAFSLHHPLNVLWIHSYPFLEWELSRNDFDVSIRDSSASVKKDRLLKCEPQKTSEEKKQEEGEKEQRLDIEVKSSANITSSFSEQTGEQPFAELRTALNQATRKSISLNARDPLHLFLRQKQIMSSLENMLFYLGPLEEMLALQAKNAGGYFFTWVHQAFPTLFLEQMQKCLLAFLQPDDSDSQSQHYLFRYVANEGNNLVRASHDVEMLQNLLKADPICASFLHSSPALQDFKIQTIRCRYPYPLSGASDTRRENSIEVEPSLVLRDAKFLMSSALSYFHFFAELALPTLQISKLELPSSEKPLVSRHVDPHPSLQPLKKILTKGAVVLLKVSEAEETKDLDRRQTLVENASRNLDYCLNVLNDLLFLKNPQDFPETFASGLITFSCLAVENAVHIFMAALPFVSLKNPKRHFFFDERQILDEGRSNREFHLESSFPELLIESPNPAIKEILSLASVLAETKNILKFDTRYPASTSGRMGEMLKELHRLCEWRKALRTGWLTRQQHIEIKFYFKKSPENCLEDVEIEIGKILKRVHQRAIAFLDLAYKVLSAFV